MKFIALGLLILVTATAAMPVHRKVVAGEELRSYSITDYARDFAKTYTPLELVKRSAILKTSIERIIAHNALYAAGRKTWYAAVTKFSDRTVDEISAFKGYNRALRFATYAPTHVSGPISVGNLPADLDWRTTNNPKQMKAVTKPKDQAQCGSCWAFSAAETIESHIAIQTGSLLTLSEQQFVSCAPNPDGCGGTGGCEGNIQEQAFNYTVRATNPLQQRRRVTPCTDHRGNHLRGPLPIHRRGLQLQGVQDCSCCHHHRLRQASRQRPRCTHECGCEPGSHRHQRCS
jgi:hypothetical protein